MNNMKKFEEIKDKVHDASGIENPEEWLWEETNGVYYPAPQEQKLEENNKLIAEFMGFEDASLSIGGRNWMRKKTKWQFGCQQYEEIPFEKLAYHVDWNWLMSVVEKTTEILRGDTFVKFIKLHPQFSSNVYIGLLKNDIKVVYKAVVEFVKWYNENKQS